MTERSKCAAVVKNPFSTATAMPKIPDGMASASLGLRRNLVTSLDFGEDSVYEMILMPHLTTPLYMGTQANNIDESGPKVRDDPAFGTNAKICTWTATSATAAKQDPLNEVSKWRLVSQGLKITLVNSNDDNDGWFEAFRFTPSYGAAEFGTTEALVANQPVPQIKLAPKQFGNRISGDNDWSAADQGNYVTGKLRNIHRYTWTNRKVNKDVDFTALTAAPTIDSGDRDDLRCQLVDTNYDCIYIRIHGRGIPAGASTQCCRPTNLMVHVAQNVEYIAGEQNNLHKYMTKSPGGITRRIYSSPYMYGRGYAPKRTMTRRRTPARRTTTTRRRRYTRK